MGLVHVSQSHEIDELSLVGQHVPSRRATRGRRLLARTCIGMILADAASAHFLEKWSEIEINYVAYRKSLMRVASGYEWSSVSTKNQRLYSSANKRRAKRHQNDISRPAKMFSAMRR